jgi:hypothetical protein
MIESIIKKIDQTYPVSVKPLGYVVKKEINGIIYPCEQINNEYKQLIDFQKLNDFHYWYLTGDVNSTEITNLYAIKRVFELTYPMRVFISKKDACDENLVLKFYKQIENLGMANRATLNILNCKIVVTSFNLVRDVVLQQEFNEVPKLMDKFSVASIDVNIIVQIDKTCLNQIC